MLHESMACCASIIQQNMDAMNREHVLNYTYSMTCYEFIISQGLVYHDIGA